MKAPPRFELPPEFAALFGDQTSEALCESVEGRDGDTALAAFKYGLLCGLGPQNAEIVFEDLMGSLTGPNAAYARAQGRSRAALSRIINRCRRHIGWPIRQPAQARPGRKPKSTTALVEKGDLA